MLSPETLQRAIVMHLWFLLPKRVVDDQAPDRTSINKSLQRHPPHQSSPSWAQNGLFQPDPKLAGFFQATSLVLYSL